MAIKPTMRVRMRAQAEDGAIMEKAAVEKENAQIVDGPEPHEGELARETKAAKGVDDKGVGGAAKAEEKREEHGGGHSQRGARREHPSQRQEGLKQRGAHRAEDVEGADIEEIGQAGCDHGAGPLPHWAGQGLGLHPRRALDVRSGAEQNVGLENASGENRLTMIPVAAARMKLPPARRATMCQGEPNRNASHVLSRQIGFSDGAEIR